MKKILITLTVFFVPLCIAHASFKPNKCPSVENIQSTAWARAVNPRGDLWDVLQENNYYDTNNEWSFLLGEFSAHNENEARVKGDEFAKVLSFMIGPMEGDGSWVCLYDSSSNVMGAAITPPLDFDKMPHALKKFRS